MYASLAGLCSGEVDAIIMSETDVDAQVNCDQSIFFAK